MLKAAPAVGDWEIGRMEGCGRMGEREAAVMLQFMASSAAQALTNPSDHTSVSFTAHEGTRDESEQPLPPSKRPSPEPPSISCESP